MTQAKPHLAPSVCERPHCAIVHTGGALAHIQRVVEEGLVFEAELLRPIPDGRETQRLVLPQRDALAEGKILTDREIITSLKPPELECRMNMAAGSCHKCSCE